jgi:uncharacterized membrane protein
MYAKPPKLGVAVFGLSSVCAGVLDAIWGEFEPDHQPIQAWGDHIPGVTVMAYITAAALIAGGLAILWRKTEKAGALTLGVVYTAFTIFWLPRLYTAPSILGWSIKTESGVLAGVGIELILVGAAALVYADAERTARWIFGCCSVSFGLAHLYNVADNATLVPAWMPFGGAFWTVLTGIAFILAGLAILTRVQDVLASRMLALMLLTFSAIALAPLPFASPHDHTAWGGNAYNLTAVGAVLIFSQCLSASRYTAAQQPRPK